ncbi:MAG: hypothetical protein PHV20_03140 [Bacteroidales bacterium]|nr:hypothetical protein [Bacteroidales bacterium]
MEQRKAEQILMMMNFMCVRLSKLCLNLALFFVLCTTTSCIQNDYDLSKGLNIEIIVGGDSLSLPLWKDSILLNSVLSDTSIFKTLDGDLSIVRKDSMTVKVDTIKSVVFNLTPPKIDSVELSFTSVTFNPFRLSPINLSSPLPIPNLDVRRSILPISNSNDYTYPITFTVDPQLLPVNARKRNKKATVVEIDTITIASDSVISQSISLDSYPLQLKKVNTIFLSNNLVHVVFDRTKMKDLNLLDRTEKLELFRIDFPSEYRISNPIGPNCRIEGNSFIIENVFLAKQNENAEYTLQVDHIDLSNTLQTNYLDFKRDIPYSFIYKFRGTTDDPQSLVGKQIEMIIDVTSAPIISDLALETNTIKVDDNVGSSHIHTFIMNAPKEILSIGDVTFKNGAYLDILISKPDISPFLFNAGYCDIQLPKAFHFKRRLNLDPITNVYRIPYSQLFQTHRLYLLGVSINQTFPDSGGEVYIDDDVKYSISGFQLAPANIRTSRVELMNNLSYNFSFSTNSIETENANITTKETTLEIPDREMVISLHRFVSNEVEKLYKADMAAPVKLELRFDLSGVPSNIDSLFFRNYTIKMPSFLRFKEGSTNSNNEIILNRGFKVKEGFTKIVELVQLDFGTEGNTLVDGYLDLDETVGFSGSVYIKQTNMNSSELSNIKVIPSVNVELVKLGLVEGKFNPKLSAIKQKINLDLPSYLLNDSVKLDISNPVILVDAGNPMGFPVNVDVQMSPRRNGAILSNAIINTNVLIACAQILGIPTWTKFGLAVNVDEVPGDYQPLVVPSLANLLTTIPDEIEMAMTPTVVADHHKVDLLAQQNSMFMKYEVRIPMKFGANFRFSYNKSIIGQKDKLNRLLQYTKKINIAATIGNTIPLTLKLELVPLDTQGKVLKDITISNIEKIKAGNTNFESQTKLVVDVFEKEGSNALINLDGFKVTVSANRDATTAGLAIKQTQYFKLDLKVLVPEGLKVDLNK